MTSRTWALGVLVWLLAATTPASAFDPEHTFKKGTFVLSAEGAYGWEFNLESKRRTSDLEFYDVGARFSLLPFDPVGRDRLWYGSLEVGLEPLYQKFTAGESAFWAGLAAVARYHLLSLGRFVPYAEVGAAAGGGDLETRYIDAHFAFNLFGGAGAQLFVSDKTALYAGYRYQHLSNANTSQPNRGIEAHVGVAGVSFYFP
jgi:opacity protein-like surface antigen